MGQLGERHAHFFLVGFCLRLDRDRDYWDRKRNRFQSNRMLLVANRVAGADVLQSNHRADIARQNFLNVFALVGVHLEQAANALVPLRARVHH